MARSHTSTKKFSGVTLQVTLKQTQDRKDWVPNLHFQFYRVGKRGTAIPMNSGQCAIPKTILQLEEGIEYEKRKFWNESVFSSLSWEWFHFSKWVIFWAMLTLKFNRSWVIGCSQCFFEKLFPIASIVCMWPDFGLTNILSGENRKIFYIYNNNIILHFNNHVTDQ